MLLWELLTAEFQSHVSENMKKILHSGVFGTHTHTHMHNNNNKIWRYVEILKYSIYNLCA